MLSKIINTKYLSECPEIVQFSDDRVDWIEAKLTALECNTLWPYIANNGHQYKYCEEIPKPDDYDYRMIR